MTSTLTRVAAGKAVLHCPQCGYSGPWTDWAPGTDGHTLRCPSCEATVG